MAAFKYLLSILFFISFCESRHLLSKKVELNNRPIIGILTEEVTGNMETNYGKHEMHLAASYVKAMEEAGARVAPVWIGMDEDYYKNLMSKINGILFPGGAVFFNNTKGYAEAGKMIYDIAIELNKNGDSFPLWGTCLGFELLAYLGNGFKEIRIDCSSSNQLLPLVPKPDIFESKMFNEIPDDIYTIITTTNSTINFHQYCVTEQDLKNSALNGKWRVMATNKDYNGVEFISAFEHIDMPFYGVQFHPEKLAYEWKASHNTPHTSEQIRASRYFSDFFVNQARRSLHKFEAEDEERKYLIYNWSPVFGIPKSSFTQIYFFDNVTDIVVDSNSVQ